MSIAVFFPNSARFHWLLYGHMTSKNETISNQKSLSGTIAKSMTSEGKCAMLLASVD